MNSEDSKIYPGIARRQAGVVPYKRKVWVYVPKQHAPGTVIPFIIAQDGGLWHWNIDLAYLMHQACAIAGRASTTIGRGVAPSTTESADQVAWRFIRTNFLGRCRGALASYHHIDA
jgi:enterochelin esterase-like enzyme